MSTTQVTAAVAAAVCPACGNEFTKRRKDQAYCCSNCRKASHKRKDRAANPANSRSSHSKRQDNTMFFDRAMRLAEMHYTTKPEERLGLLKLLVDQARAGVQPTKTVLTNQMLLYAGKDKQWLFVNQLPASHRTISQLADAYCRHFLGASIREVVSENFREPETGEVFNHQPGYAERRHAA